MKWIVTVVLVLCILISLLYIFREAVINAMAFYPDSFVTYSPDEEFVHEVFLETSDNVSIHCYYLTGKNKNQKVMLFFHGNAGNSSHRIDDAKMIYSMGADVLLVSYRGYGKSEGRPTERGIQKDAHAACDYLVEQGYNDRDIYIYGRSLGSVPAIETAKGKDVSGLILVTPLSSGEDLARSMGLGPLSSVAKGKFDNLAKINEVHARILVIHGDRDGIVPFSHGKKLYETYQGEKEFVTIHGGGHNDLTVVDPGAFWNSIEIFIQ
jgi:hypothetical protein